MTDFFLEKNKLRSCHLVESCFEFVSVAVTVWRWRHSKLQFCVYKNGCLFAAAFWAHMLRTTTNQKVVEKRCTLSKISKMLVTGRTV
jgi:hypothetical protein